MAKFIKAQDIPAGANALVWTYDAETKTTDVVFKKTVRAAKMEYKKIPARPDYESISAEGWMLITDIERAHGIMVW